MESDLTAEALAELRAGLREYGFTEGQNVAFERRVNVVAYEQLPKAAADLVQAKVDVIVAWGNTAARAAAKATSSVPVVMLVSIDPVASGLASSLSRPGRNVTGLTTLGSDLEQKRLELLKEILPGVDRIAVLLNPNSRDEVEALKQIEAAARPLGVRVYAAEAGAKPDIGPAIAGARRAGAGALMIVPSTMLRANRTQITQAAAANRLPGIYPDATYVEAGGLVSYGRSTQQSLRMVAGYAAKILKGAKPAVMPIEQASKLELVLSTKAAKALGLAVPETIRVRADRVIE